MEGFDERKSILLTIDTVAVPRLTKNNCVTSRIAFMASVTFITHT